MQANWDIRDKEEGKKLLKRTAAYVARKLPEVITPEMLKVRLKPKTKKVVTHTEDWD
jgi:hypothetical protein